MVNQEENLSERVDPLTTGDTTYDNEDVKGNSTFHGQPQQDSADDTADVEDPAEEAGETAEEEAAETPDAQASDVSDVPPADDTAEDATPDNSVGDGQSA